MKVLLWMSDSFDRRTPSEHILSAVVEALCSDGHSVHILQKDTGGELPKLPHSLRALGVTSCCVPTKLCAKSNFIGRYLAELGYVLACGKFLRKKDGYDAVFLQSNNVAGAAMLLLKRKFPGVRVTYNVQDIFPQNAAYVGKLSPKGIPFRILAAMQRYAYRKADSIITISPDMEDQLAEAGAPRDKLLCVYNWAYRDEPYADGEPDLSQIRSMLPEDGFHVVYAGNIGVMQNIHILLDVAERMRDEPVSFHIFGDGQYKEKLVSQARERCLTNVSFWPMQKSALAPAIYTAADVNVVPLVKDICKTALPSKTAVCMACGKPVLFCFGGESRFLRMLAETEPIVSCPTAEALCDAIRRIRQGYVPRDLRGVYAQHMQRTKNARLYARAITGAQAKQTDKRIAAK